MKIVHNLITFGKISYKSVIIIIQIIIYNRRNMWYNVVAEEERRNSGLPMRLHFLQHNKNTRKGKEIRKYGFQVSL